MILQEPIVALAAHNGHNFDFPLLLCEMLRGNLSTNVFEQWYFIDTLDVSRAQIQYSCVKLQCLCKEMAVDSGNVYLRNILNTLAQHVGMSIRQLLSLHFVHRL